MHSSVDIHDFVISRKYFNWTLTRNLKDLRNTDNLGREQMAEQAMILEVSSATDQIHLRLLVMVPSPEEFLESPEDDN